MGSCDNIGACVNNKPANGDKGIINNLACNGQSSCARNGGLIQNSACSGPSSCADNAYGGVLDGAGTCGGDTSCGTNTGTIIDGFVAVIKQ